MSNWLFSKGFSFLNRINSVWTERPLEPATEREQQLIAELRGTISKLPPAVATIDFASEKHWVDYSIRLRCLLQQEDPRAFLRWKLIQQTMFADAPYCNLELRDLKKRNEWTVRWKTAIREDEFGQPRPFLFYPLSSGNLIHHAYHLAQFEDKVGIKISNLEFIFEFGGGYGSICRLIHKLDYKRPYILYDLPEFSALQRFYLQGVNLLVKDQVISPDPRTGIICSHEMRNLRALVRNVDSRSLFIATWSFSEAPEKIREEIIEIISSFNYFLIAYKETFAEINNVAFFEKWRRSFGEKITWFDWPIDHLPGNRYLVGVNTAFIRANGGTDS